MRTIFNILSIAAIFILTSCEKDIFTPEPGTDPEALFENLWETFDENYAVFDERGVDWKEVYGEFRPQVSENTTSNELASIFKQMLRRLDDGHVSLTLPGQRIFYANRIVDEEIDDELFDLDLIKGKYLNNEYLQNAGEANTYGWIGNIGYWHLDYSSDNWVKTGEILDHFAQADGLIIDMRHNGGGDFTWVMSEFGRFTDQTRLAFRSRTKNGPGPDDFTPWFDWDIKPSGQYFDKPIVLLTDRYTISAGERAVLAFKTLPNVLHLGEPTNGAISTKMGRELANGWYYTISTQEVDDAEGHRYEGPGIPVDEVIRNTMEEMLMGVDRVLEEAITRF